MQSMNEISKIMVNGVEYDINDTEKADKSTTLSGYGITDAYTKTEIFLRYLEYFAPKLYCI